MLPARCWVSGSEEYRLVETASGVCAFNVLGSVRQYMRESGWFLAAHCSVSASPEEYEKLSIADTCSCVRLRGLCCISHTLDVKVDVEIWISTSPCFSGSVA